MGAVFTRLITPDCIRSYSQLTALQLPGMTLAFLADGVIAEKIPVLPSVGYACFTCSNCALRKA
ncbi:MAG: hypothetical protein ACKV1O_30660 [Saprospiraceae bacterium]